MELTYRQSGDYLLPNLTLESETAEPLGKYGRMRKNFLKEHRKGQYNALLLTDGLTAHLLEIDRTARAQIEQTVQQMAAAEGVTERLKAENQMAWVCRMNSFRDLAEEQVMRELINS